MLVKYRERGCTHDNLVVGIKTVSRQDRRGSFGVRVSNEDWDRLTVHFEIVVVEPAPCGDITVVTEEREGLRRDVIARIKCVGPVPSVQGGT